MTRRPTTIGLVTILLGLLPSCGDQGTQPSKPAPATEAPAAAGSTKAIHPPQAVQARLRTEPAAHRAVPELITAPGEVALDLKQVAKITSRIGARWNRFMCNSEIESRRAKRWWPSAACNSIFSIGVWFDSTLPVPHQTDD